MRPVFATIPTYYLAYALFAVLAGWWLIMRLRKAAGIWRLRYYAFPRPWLKHLHSHVPLYTRLPWELRAPYQDKVLQFIDAKRFIPCGTLNEIDEAARVIIAGNAALLLLNSTRETYSGILTVQLFPGGDPNADGGARSSAVALWWDSAKKQASDPRDARTPLDSIARELGWKSLPAPLLLTAWARVRYPSFAAEWPDALAGTSAGEPEDVFAVATEMFLAEPATLLQKRPALYDAMRHFYLIDPARWSRKP